MSSDAIFDLIEQERIRLADRARAWTDEQWDVSSLADGWRVREVMAHLTMGFSVSIPSFLVGMVRHRGSFDRFVDRWARDTVAATPDPAAFVEAIRANAGARFTPPGIGPAAPLTDVVVHGLDMCLPLGLDVSDISLEARTIVLDFATSAHAHRFGVPSDAFDGRRLEATDLDWAHGTGPTVAASSLDLIAHLCRARPLPA